MKKQIIIAMLLLIVSCSDHINKNEIRYRNEEIKALNDIFTQIKYPDYSEDGIKNVLIIHDTLTIIPSIISDIFSNRIDNFSLYFPKLDSSYRKLLMNLFEYRLPVYFNIHDLKNTGRYKLLNEIQRNEFDKNKIIGILSYSRIIFDNTFEKGVLFSSLKCSGNTSTDLIIIIIKSNGKWKVNETNVLKTS